MIIQFKIYYQRLFRFNHKGDNNLIFNILLNNKKNSFLIKLYQNLIYKLHKPEILILMKNNFS